MDFIGRHKKKQFFFAIFLVSLIPLLWFKLDGSVLTVGDWGIQFNRGLFFELLSSVWDGKFSLGKASPNQIAYLLPYGLFIYFSTIIGISISTFQKIVFVYWFAAGAFGMAFLSKKFSKNLIIRFFAVVLFLFNPFTLQVVWYLPHGMIQQSYLFIPWIILIADYIFSKRRKYLAIIVIALIWTLTMGSTYVGINYVITHWLVFGAIWLGYILITIKRKEKSTLFYLLKSFVLIMVAWIAFNSFWLFPVIGELSSVKNASQLDSIISDSQQLVNTSVELPDLIRFTGLINLSTEYKGDSVYSWIELYNSPAFQLAMLFLGVLVIVGFICTIYELRKRKYADPIVIAILALLTISAVFATGIFDPLGNFVLWFYRNVPLISSGFRAAFIKWGIIFVPIAIITITILVDYVYKNIKNNKYSKYLSIPLFLTVIIFAIPFINGNVIYRGGEVTPSFEVVVPDEYYKMNNYFLENEGTILALPMSKTNKQNMNWENGILGGYFTKWFTGNNTVINADTGEESYEIVHNLAKEIEVRTNGATTNTIKSYVEQLGVNYIVYFKDTNWDYNSGHSWFYNHSQEKIETLIDDLDLILVQEFGDIKIYTYPGNRDKVHLTNDYVLNNSNSNCGYFSNVKGLQVDTELYCLNLSPKSITEIVGNKLVWELPINIPVNLTANNNISSNSILSVEQKDNELIIKSPESEVRLVDGQNIKLNQIDLDKINIEEAIIKSPQGYEYVNQVKYIRNSNQNSIWTKQNPYLDYSTRFSSLANFDVIDASADSPGIANFSAIETGNGIRLTSNNRLAALKLTRTDLEFDQPQVLSIRFDSGFPKSVSARAILRFDDKSTTFYSNQSYIEGSALQSDVFVDYIGKKPNSVDLYFYIDGRNEPASVEIYTARISKLSKIKDIFYSKSSKQNILLTPAANILSFDLTGNTEPVEVNNASFEKPIGVQSIINTSAAVPLAPDYDLDWVEEPTSGKYALKMTTNSHNQAIKLFPESALENSNYYIASFDYKVLEGFAPDFAVIRRGEDVNISRYKLENIENSWINKSIVFINEPNTRLNEFYFYNNYFGSTNRILIDNFRLEKINYIPELELTNVNSNIEKDVSDVSYYQLNQYTYKVNFNEVDDSILNLQQSYNDNWEIFYNCSLNIFGLCNNSAIDIKNVEANGWHNSWLIDESFSNKEIIIQYSGQKYFVTGFVIGIITLSILLLLTIKELITYGKNKYSNHYYKEI